MKLLKIEGKQGFFMGADGSYVPVDKLTKEELLRMVNLTLSEDVEFDEFKTEEMPNQAHQIIYKSVYEKLLDLSTKKAAFVDKTKRHFLKEYEKYKDSGSTENTKTEVF